MGARQDHAHEASCVQSCTGPPQAEPQIEVWEAGAPPTGPALTLRTSSDRKLRLYLTDGGCLTHTGCLTVCDKGHEVGGTAREGRELLTGHHRDQTLLPGGQRSRTEREEPSSCRRRLPTTVGSGSEKGSGQGLVGAVTPFTHPSPYPTSFNLAPARWASLIRWATAFRDARRRGCSSGNLGSPPSAKCPAAPRQPPAPLTSLPGPVWREPQGTV